VKEVFIHLGGSRMICIREVIAILDANVAKSATPPFLNACHQKKKIEHLSPDEIKSYVITTHHIYASPISSTTLKKRADLTQKI
jgi:extracellular matrix regulatory protein B